MATSTSGKAMPIALVGGKIANRLSIAGSFGDMPLADGPMNPLDLFDNADLSADAYFAVVIFNTLSTPLRLKDSYVGTVSYEPDQYIIGDQTNYPVVGANHTWHPPGNLVVVPTPEARPNEIPGARPFPDSQKHLRPDGNPQTLWGVGLYTFQASFQMTPTPLSQSGPSHVRRALSFSTSADGSGPVVAVAFRAKGTCLDDQSTRAPWSLTMYVAVTADLEANYADLATFYQKTMLDDNNNDGYDSGPNPTSVAYDKHEQVISAAFAHTASKVSKVEARTLTVWVRDNPSSAGQHATS